MQAEPTASSEAGRRDWQRLGGRLREVREYLNLSQQYVAEHTGIPRSAVSDIERGERKVDSLELKKLARLYRRPVGFFLDEHDAASPGDHAIALLSRALTDLTEDDVAEVRRFAEFLRQDKAARRSREP
jgi:transcriptional regulator with XRE-family HTH domain